MKKAHQNLRYSSQIAAGWGLGCLPMGVEHRIVAGAAHQDIKPRIPHVEYGRLYSKRNKPRPPAVPKIAKWQKDVRLLRQPGCWLVAAIHLKSVIAHWSSGTYALTIYGLSIAPKRRSGYFVLVGELAWLKQLWITNRGPSRSENAGMSNERHKNMSAVNSKVSGQG